MSELRFIANYNSVIVHKDARKMTIFGPMYNGHPFFMGWIHRTPLWNSGYIKYECNILSWVLLFGFMHIKSDSGIC